MKTPAFLVAIALCGCSQQAPPPPAAPATPTDEATLPFVGRAWLTSDVGKPRGTMWVFLPNGTLVMDSCFETFRLVEWRSHGADKIAWREDQVPVEAEWSQPRPDQLLLTVHLMNNDTLQHSFIAANVPYTCPDMPK